MSDAQPTDEERRKAWIEFHIAQGNFSEAVSLGADPKDLPTSVNNPSPPPFANGRSPNGGPAGASREQMMAQMGVAPEVMAAQMNVLSQLHGTAPRMPSSGNPPSMMMPGGRPQSPPPLQSLGPMAYKDTGNRPAERELRLDEDTRQRYPEEGRQRYDAPMHDRGPPGIGAGPPQRPPHPGGPPSGFNPLSGDWQCPGCPGWNFARRMECNKCGAPRPAGVQKVMMVDAPGKGGGGGKGGGKGMPPGMANPYAGESGNYGNDWQCPDPNCANWNWARRDICNKCKVCPRPAGMGPPPRNAPPGGFPAQQQRVRMPAHRRNYYDVETNARCQGEAGEAGDEEKYVHEAGKEDECDEESAAMFMLSRESGKPLMFGIVSEVIDENPLRPKREERSSSGGGGGGNRRGRIRSEEEKEGG